MKKNTKHGNCILDDDLTANLLEAVKPLTPPAGLRSKVLSKALGVDIFSTGSTVRRDIAWQTLLPGIDYKMLIYDALTETKSFLLRAAAGTRLPAHKHSGREECLVLEGEFSIGELHLKRGDFHCMVAGSTHQEAYTKNGTIVYIRASNKDYPGINPQMLHG